MTESNHPSKRISGSDTILSNPDSISSNNDISANPIFSKRREREWSQADLAKRAGVSRAAVSAIECGHLTPSVAIALSLAKVLGCSVEELFGRPSLHHPSAPEWAWPAWQDPCRYWEAEIGGRRILYPTEALALNKLPHDGVWSAGVAVESRPAAAEMTLIVASCDPAVGLLAHEYTRESGFRMVVFPRSGAAALDLLQKGLVHLAALHRSTDQHPELNATTARSLLDGRARLLRVARWESGLALPSTNRTRSVKTASRQVMTWAGREPGSAARESLDRLLGGRAPSGRIVGSHHAVAEAVLAGWADAGVCVKLPAAEAHLNFLPVQTESVDFCYRGHAENDPRIQAMIRVLRSRRFREIISQLPGYDARTTGELTSI
ncbi:MAG: substrate-binding domain-containing protein [Verrucomicrobiota bacterium]